MIPALMAAKPLIKYGVMAGAAALLVGSIWGHGYFTGKKVVHKEWDSAIAQASAQAVNESIKANAMESAVVKANDQAERVIEVKAEQVKKEVVHHARKNPKSLAAATIAIYDRLISLPNEAGRSVPTADPRAGTSEVQRAGLASQTVTRIQEGNGNAVEAESPRIPASLTPTIQRLPDDELTTEELAQAAVDFAEKFALIKNAYKGLSDWNDGRERLELERLPHEAK